MVYHITHKKETGRMPIYGQVPAPKSWKGDQTGAIKRWTTQAAGIVNNQFADQSRFTLPVRSGKWNASRRDW